MCVCVCECVDTKIDLLPAGWVKYLFSIIYLYLYSNF